ncbi:hypothetical protein A6764_08925 [Brevibacillus sp. WF146]|nr:hypothetical protein [Brevibacillus sp. WF146]UYZ15033.1 hypothetical protein A6764_08925 [Brevibacillus sp. WF146]
MVSLLFLKRPALDLPQDPAAVSFPFRGDRNAHQLDAAVQVGQPGDDHVADRSAALPFGRKRKKKLPALFLQAGSIKPNICLLY